MATLFYIIILEMLSSNGMIYGGFFEILGIIILGIITLYWDIIAGLEIIKW